MHEMALTVYAITRTTPAASFWPELMEHCKEKIIQTFFALVRMVAVEYGGNALYVTVQLSIVEYGCMMRECPLTMR